jgi:C4-dicarboxylate transporter DctQ subunit
MAILARAVEAGAAALVVALVGVLLLSFAQGFLGWAGLWPWGQVQWLTEAAEFGLVPLALLGAAVALRARAHHGVDALVRLLPGRARRIVDGTVWALLAAFGAGFAYLGAGYVASAAGVGGTLATVAVPKWPFYLAYPAAGVLFALFALEALLAVVAGEDVHAAGAEPPPASPPPAPGDEAGDRAGARPSVPAGEGAIP